MTSSESTLADLELDAFTELTNIGVSRAAADLRKMVGHHVILSVPSIQVVDRKTAAAFLDKREGSHLVSVLQDFDGSFYGRAMLIFPHRQSVDLARAVLQEETADEAAITEALSETGNIILNRCIGTIANQLNLSLTISLPKVMRGSGAELFEAPGPSDETVMILHINIAILELDIRGYIAMLMDIASVGKLKALLANFIAEAMTATG